MKLCAVGFHKWVYVDMYAAPWWSCWPGTTSAWRGCVRCKRDQIPCHSLGMNLLHYRWQDVGWYDLLLARHMWWEVDKFVSALFGIPPNERATAIREFYNS